MSGLNMSALRIAKMANQKNLPVLPINNVLALRARDPWSEATQKARQTAIAREDVISDLDARLLSGVSLSKAVLSLQAAAEAGSIGIYLAQQMRLVSKKGKCCPTRSVLFEWHSAYKKV